MSKLTIVDAVVIRILVSKHKYAQKDVAALYGVNKSTISRVMQGKMHKIEKSRPVAPTSPTYIIREGSENAPKRRIGPDKYAKTVYVHFYTGEIDVHPSIRSLARYSETSTKAIRSAAERRGKPSGRNHRISSFWDDVAFITH